MGNLLITFAPTREQSYFDVWGAFFSVGHKFYSCSLHCYAVDEMFIFLRYQSFSVVVTVVHQTLPHKPIRDNDVYVTNDGL